VVAELGVCVSHGTHTNESWNTYEGVMTHVCMRNEVQWVSGGVAEVLW